MFRYFLEKKKIEKIFQDETFFISHFKSSTKRGMSLVEVIVGLAIISTSFLAVFGTYNFFIRTQVKNAEMSKVIFLLEEGVESVRSLRDKSWSDFSNLATSTDYYLVFENGAWVATTSQVYVENFERKFILENVYRDAQGDISSTGTLDDGTKKVNVFVSWFSSKATSTYSISTYLSNLYE